MGCHGSRPVSEPTEKGSHSADLTGMTAEERALNQLRQIFNGVDRNGDGSVDKSALMAALALEKDAKLGALLKEADLNEQVLFGTLDVSKGGRVTWDEFEKILKSPAILMAVKASGPAADPQLPATEKAMDYLRDIFEETNVNIDGTVLKEELAEALAADAGVENVIRQAGLNPKYCVLQPLRTIVEGKITWDEFEAHLHRGGASPTSGGVPASSDKLANKDYMMVIDFLVEEENRVAER